MRGETLHKFARFARELITHRFAPRGARHFTPRNNTRRFAPRSISGAPYGVFDFAVWLPIRVFGQRTTTGTNCERIELSFPPLVTFTSRAGGPYGVFEGSKGAPTGVRTPRSLGRLRSPGVIRFLKKSKIAFAALAADEEPFAFMISPPRFCILTSTGAKS